MRSEMPGKVSRECMKRLGLVRFSKWNDFWDSEPMPSSDGIDSESKISVMPATGNVFIEDAGGHMSWVCTVNSDEELTAFMIASKRMPIDAPKLHLQIVEETCIEGEVPRC